MACSASAQLIVQSPSLSVPNSVVHTLSNSTHAAVLLATNAMATPVTMQHAQQHAELLHGATVQLQSGARDIASYHDAFQQVATRAVYVLDMCLDEPPLSFPDAVPTAAAALAFLTAYSETMPRDTLLKDTHLLQHIVAAAIGSSIPDDDIRCLGWAAALALTRRLVERTSCFRSRLASAGLLPLLERARELLELAQQQPQRVFASLVCRRELMYALQLLCHVAGTGDAYYIARLHQLHMAEALLLFGQADVGAGVVDEEVTTLVVKLQGAACRLHGYLVMPPGD